MKMYLFMVVEWESGGKDNMNQYSFSDNAYIFNNNLKERITYYAII